MADSENENILGFVDRRKTQGNPGGVGGRQFTGQSTHVYRAISVADMRATLAGQVPALYTTNMLDTMTKNDMVYALRTLNDAGGI